MRDFFETLKDAFPVLKEHPVGAARSLLVILLLAAFYSAKGLRKRICLRMSSKLESRAAARTRFLYVFQDSELSNNWKYYTSETTGKGNTGDDLIWTLVTWPGLRPKDSFRLSGVVGMVRALSESQAKLKGRWGILHRPDRGLIGLIPARGAASKLSRASASALRVLGSI